MPKRPVLPLQTEVDIEVAREAAQKRISERFSTAILFDDSRTQKKPAHLKLELGHYATDLFDAEAGFYGNHANDTGQLQTWLTELALCLQAELMEHFKPFSAIHDYHCTEQEREDTIAQALRERIQHWMLVSRNLYVFNLFEGVLRPALQESKITAAPPAVASVTHALQPLEAAATTASESASAAVGTVGWSAIPIENATASKASIPGAANAGGGSAEGPDHAAPDGDIEEEKAERNELRAIPARREDARRSPEPPAESRQKTVPAPKRDAEAVVPEWASNLKTKEGRKLREKDGSDTGRPRGTSVPMTT